MGRGQGRVCHGLFTSLRCSVAGRVRPRFFGRWPVVCVPAVPACPDHTVGARETLSVPLRALLVRPHRVHDCSAVGAVECGGVASGARVVCAWPGPGMPGPMLPITRVVLVLLDSRVPPGVALPSGQGDPDKDRPPNHGPPRARTAADDSTGMRSDAPNDRRSTPACGAVVSKKDGLPVRPEAWRSLLAPTRHLYGFPIPVRTSIIPLRNISVITQTSGIVSRLHPNRLHPNRSRTSRPPSNPPHRPPLRRRQPEPQRKPDQAAAIRPHPSPHPVVAARPNPPHTA